MFKVTPVYGTWLDKNGYFNLEDTVKVLTTLTSKLTFSMIWDVEASLMNEEPRKSKSRKDEHYFCISCDKGTIVNDLGRAE